MSEKEDKSVKEEDKFVKEENKYVKDEEPTNIKVNDEINNIYIRQRQTLGQLTSILQRLDNMESAAKAAGRK